ncbi:MAG TPA: Uma2 family endonuclease [Rubrobacter sp.]|nr:Uma2 family endonuclease [Rubrobacter sp.]
MTETKIRVENPPVVLRTRPALEMVREYTEYGARLGWLMDPEERKVHVHKPVEPVQIPNNPGTLSGAPVFPGFVLALEPIWEPGF